jgi:hypothetical protein
VQQLAIVLVLQAIQLVHTARRNAKNVALDNSRNILAITGALFATPTHFLIFWGLQVKAIVQSAPQTPSLFQVVVQRPTANVLLDSLLIKMESHVVLAVKVHSSLQLALVLVRHAAQELIQTT